MKRILFVLLAAAAVMSGCGKADGSSDDVKDTSSSQAEGTETASAAEEEISTDKTTKDIPAETAADTKEDETMDISQETTTEAQTETVPPTQPPTEEPHDGKLVRMADFIPDLVVDLRYATDNNFTGQVIYESPEAYLCYGSVKKLMKVQAKLKTLGYRLVIWDAYRPYEAQQKLWEVYPDPVYVADPRNGITSHSRGNTVDISIAYEDGTLVEMPSGFDEFSTLADRDYTDVPKEQAANSLMLEQIMIEYGFKPYFGEWWHYSDNEIYEIEY